MVAPAVEGIDLFKIAGRSISGWVPSFKMDTVAPVKQPFCSQLEERLLLWLEYHPQVKSYARGDIGPQFATTYRLPIPRHAPFAIGYVFDTALGLPLRGYWHTRKPKLMGHLHHYGTEFLVVDDAHDLSLKHLMLLKELTDQGRLQYDHPLGLCLVAAGRGNTIPLKETLDLPETTWIQFRRRFDKLQPFCRIAGHTSEEVREILASLETVYRELFPQLNRRQWYSFIYTWLTQSAFDPTHSGRVTMDYLMKLVTTAPVRAPSNRMGESCGSNRITNAKRRRPLPNHDGPGRKRTGRLSADSTSGVNWNARW